MTLWCQMTKRKKKKSRMLIRNLLLQRQQSTHHHHHHQTLFFLLALKSSSFFLFFLLTSLMIANSGHFVEAHIYMYAGCSQEKYQPNSPFEANLNSLLSSMVSSSSQTLYNSFTLANDTSASLPDSAIYGLYQCRGDLKPRDCSTCIASAVNQIGLVCPYTYGATLQLDTCLVRYDHTDFLGKLDTSIGFKKCSKSVSGDGDFLKKRDAVLAELEGAVGGFKVSVAGSVEGFAQCLGDLSPGDCSSCLSEAVSEVKTLCGSSAAADVFLAQCYARYWASGYYDSSSDSSNDDDVGKTVAIIVGVVAGVAVFIVFLSFCRKALG